MSSSTSARPCATVYTLPVPGRDHLLGPVDAPIMLLEYGDYECLHCAQAYPILKAIQERLGRQLCFAYRNYPLANVHPHAELAAQAAEAAGAQGNFWEMHDILYEHYPALDPSSLAAYAGAISLNLRRFMAEMLTGVHAPRVRQDFQDGIHGGVNGTPTLFINGERYVGDRNEEDLLGAMVRAAR